MSGSGGGSAQAVSQQKVCSLVMASGPVGLSVIERLRPFPTVCFLRLSPVRITNSGARHKWLLCAQ